jgi:uncharacterized membrane protein
MWTRKELKEKAKKAFYRNYWITVFVTVIYGFVIGEFWNGSRLEKNINSAKEIAVGESNLPDATATLIETYSDVILGGLFVFLLFWGIVLICFHLFVGSILEIGAMRFYEENSDRKAEFRLLGSGFKSGYYGKKVLTMFLKTLYVVLWSLLLLIPGIIKNYEYSMISYILAENPEISRTRAFEISKEMMKGEKWDAFVLDLSFIGWHILGGITFGIVKHLYTKPYCVSTWTELYKVNRQKVLQAGSVTISELPGWENR